MSLLSSPLGYGYLTCLRDSCRGIAKGNVAKTAEANMPLPAEIARLHAA